METDLPWLEVLPIWSRTCVQNCAPENFFFSNNQCIYTRWFKVTFSSPSWRSLNPLKGSLNHPKKVTLNHQVQILFRQCLEDDRHLFGPEKGDIACAGAPSRMTSLEPRAYTQWVFRGLGVYTNAYGSAMLPCQHGWLKLTASKDAVKSWCIFGSCPGDQFQLRDQCLWQLWGMACCPATVATDAELQNRRKSNKPNHNESQAICEFSWWNMIKLDQIWSVMCVLK